MTDDTLIATGERNVLRMERRYAHPPEKVWRAVTEPEHLSAWFPFPVELELRPGGPMRFGPPEDPGMRAGVVTELDPPRLFAFEWGGDDLRFELERSGDAGCRLVFTHTFGDRYGAASFAAGWTTCLRALAAGLDEREPDPPEDVNQLHEEYLDAFGLAAGEAEVGPDGWSVRFERQLTQPAERAWRLLTDGDHEPAVGAAPPGGATVEPVAAGPLQAVEPPRMLEYEWLVDGRAVGRVRVELGQGTGHGARLVLTQSGPPELAAERAAALAAWEPVLGRLGHRLAAERRVAG